MPRFNGAPAEGPPQPQARAQPRFGGAVLAETMADDPATYYGLDFAKPVTEVRDAIASKVPEHDRPRVLQAWAQDFVARERAQGGLGLDDRVRTAMRGTLIGEFNDEANAGIKAGLGMAPYDEALAYERERDRSFQEENPTEAAALGLGGALSGGGGGLWRRVVGSGTGRTTRVLSNAGQGAAYGALSGFGQGEGGLLNRAEGARNWGAFGAAAGAPFGLLGGRVPQTGRPDAATMVDIFGRANVSPTMPTIFDNRGLGFTTNMLGGSIFGSPIPNTALRQVEEAGQQTERLARGVGPVTEPSTAGETIQRGAERFARERVPTTLSPQDIIAAPTRATSFRTKADALYGVIDQMMPTTANTRRGGRIPSHPLRETVQALDAIETRFADPSLQQAFAHPQVRQVTDYIREAGQRGVSWGDLRQLRTSIGRLLDTEEIMRTMPQAELDRLYGALSRDMADMAQHSARRGHTGTGPNSALRAFQRADLYYAAGARRIEETLKKVVGARSGEQAYSDVVRMALQGSGADVRRLMQVRSSLRPEEWADVTSTALSRLGRSGRTGEAWSPAYFLNNLRSMSPQGRNLLFNGTRYQGLTRALEDLETVAGELQRTGRLQNFSNTANYMVQGGTLAGLGSLGMDKLGYALMAGLGANAAARVLSSPTAVRWLATTLRRGGPAGRSLLTNRNAGLVEIFKEDPELAQKVNDFANDMMGQMN